MIETLKNLDGVKAFFSTRHHGESLGSFSSLNVGFHVGDNADHVLKNHKLIKKYFTEDAELAYMNQLHSNEVCNLGTTKAIPSCDSLVTNEKKKILMVMVADCLPILFFDKNREVIAAIHAGRAGTFSNIVKETLENMQNEYGSDMGDIYVSIGPHIKSCCYEVGQDIYDQAVKLGYENAVKSTDGGYFLNLHTIIFEQLLDQGLKNENIESIDLCTSCHVDQFFSYRKEGETGRFCGVIMLE